MNVIPTQPVATPPTHEPPRPAQHQTQETRRPVLEPARAEATTQETRRHEDRGSDRKTHAEAHTQTQSQDAPAARKGQDPLVGAILDVFA